MSAPIEAVIFDMDGVLCAYDFAARIAGLARLTGCAAQAIESEIFDSGWDERSDRGEIGTEEYLAGCSARLGVQVTRAVWLEARAAVMTPDREVLDIARALVKVMPAAVLTNNNRLIADNLAGMFPEVPEIFGDRVYVSAVLGLAKPDPAAYLAVLTHLGAAPPGRALFIDDRADYIAGAVRAGLQTHLFKSAAALRTDLARLGLCL